MRQYSAGFLIQYLRLSPIRKKLEEESVQFKLQESREESVMPSRQCSEPCRQSRSNLKRNWSLRVQKSHKQSIGCKFSTFLSILLLSYSLGFTAKQRAEKKKKTSLLNNVQKPYGHGRNRTCPLRWQKVLVSFGAVHV